MDKISIFNYEAFYLDYLECNLGEEDTALLMEFLKKHPEFRMEEEELPVLQSPSSSLDKDFLSTLKQVDLSTDTITASTVEQFMIASIEGQLNSQKQIELEIYLSVTPAAAKEMELFKKTILPAPTMIFDGKDDLKKKKTIMLWPYLSIAAAAAVIAFFVWIGVRTNVTEAPSYAKKNTPEIKKDERKLEEDPTINRDQFVADQDQTTTLPEKGIVIPDDNKESKGEDAQPRKELDKINDMRTRTAGNLTLAMFNEEPSRITQPSQSPPVQQVRSDYASLGFDQMSNPIKPITKKIAEVTNKEIDFRSAKPTKRNSGGFFLKIGSLEISHKKH
jgi:hypothetical protein